MKRSYTKRGNYTRGRNGSYPNNNSQKRGYSYLQSKANGKASGTTNTNHASYRSSNQNQSNNINNNISEEPPTEETMRCLSFLEEGTKIAFAFYDEGTNEITLEETYAHGCDAEPLIENFLRITGPNLVLVPIKTATNVPLLELLTTTLGDDNNSETVASTSNSARMNSSKHKNTIPYRMLKSGSYDIKACRSLILNKLRVLTLLKAQRREHLQQQHDHARAFHQQSTYNERFNRRFHNDATNSTNTDMGSYHSLASLINFDSYTLVRALGSLLSFLQSTIFRMESDSTITVNAVKQAKINTYMKIDYNTLKSLHIFNTDFHVLSQRQRKRETLQDFSLYTLLNRTKSKMGKQMLREIMLKPLLEKDKIELRLDGVQFFCLQECAQYVCKLNACLSKIGAVDKILLRLQKCNACPMDFIILIQALKNGIEIATICSGELWHIAAMASTDSQGGQSNTTIQAKGFLESILNRCNIPEMRRLYDRLVSTIDTEVTLDTKDCVCINYGFNEQLDSAKESLESLDETLSLMGTQILHKHPELSQVKVIYLPQVGFLITLDKRHHAHNIATNEFPDLPPDFNFVFIQDHSAYFKNPDMKQLDEEIGDLDAFIKDTEAMIVNELEEEILDCESELRESFNALAELDCILSFSKCSMDYNFVRPEIVPPQTDGNNVILVQNGKHPLQELILEDTKDFIPNDTEMNFQNRIHIITGPNFSGKSCYTRQVGIMVYMAQIGCFVPCDKAKFSIIDQILARINSVETCAVPQSTFQLDLVRLT